MSVQPSLTRSRLVGLVLGLLLGPSLAPRPARAEGQLMVATGHSREVNTIAFSPDGRYLASGSEDSSVRLWELSSGRELRKIAAKGGVTGLAYAPDGKTIAIGTSSWSVQLVDATTGAGRRELIYSGGYVKGLAFSRDGQVLAAGGWGKKLQLWNPADGKSLATLAGHDDHVDAIALSPDGHYLASVGRDKRLKLWDTSTNTLAGTIELSDASLDLSAVALSPDGRTVAVESGDHLKLYEVPSGRLLRTFDESIPRAVGLAFSPDGKTLALAPSGGPVRLFDLGSSGAAVRLPSELAIDFRAVAFSPDGKLLAAAGNQACVVLWDVATRSEVRRLSSGAQAVVRVRALADGRRVAVGMADGRVKIWDLGSGRALERAFRVATWRLEDLAASADGRTLATVGEDSASEVSPWLTGKPKIRVWDVETGVLVSEAEEPSARRVALSPDGSLVAAGGREGQIGLWDARRGTFLRKLEGHKRSVDALTFSSDGRLIASGGTEGVIRLFEAATGQEVTALPKVEELIDVLEFSGDGKHLASRGFLWKIGILWWDLATGTKESEIWAPYGRSAALSPDGKRIAFTQDGKIRIRDLKSGKEERPFAAPEGSLTYTTDGRYLISGGADTKVRLWDPKSGQELATLIAAGPEDWVVVAPDGRFDASEGGMKRIYYVQGMEIIPLESFFDRYYVPGLLTRLVGPTTAKATPATGCKGDFAQCLRPPPKLTFVSPRAGERTKSEEIDVEVQATDQGAGIDEIRIYLNGKAVSDEQRGVKRKSSAGRVVTQKVRVTLLPGVNELSAVAFDGERTQSAPEVVSVTLDRPSAEARLFVVAVGLNEYQNTKYNLTFGKADAEDMARALTQVSEGIFREVKSRVLVDREATRKNIIEGLDGVAKEARPEDVLVFFYAGHGVMSEAASGPGEFYLAPHEVTQLYGSTKHLADKGLAARELRDLATKIRAQKQLFIIDACQSGGAVDTFAVRGAAEEKAIKQLARSAGIVVLASTGTDQYATETKELGHGLFTHALLKALRGEAPPALRDRRVTVKGLEAYLGEEIPELTRRYRGSAQYPNSFAKGMDFPIGVVAP